MSRAITVKILYFVWFGASSCLLPYLSLHMRALRIPVWETALISAIFSLFQLLIFSLAGSITRSARSYKESTLWCLLFTAIGALIILLAPVVPIPVERSISMNFQCGPGTKPGILVDKCNHDCEEPTLWQTNLETYFSKCHVDCPNKKGIFKNSADVCFDDHQNRVCHVVEVNNTLSENFTFSISLGKVEVIDNQTCLYDISGVTWHQVYFQRISCPIIIKEKSVKCILKCDLHEVPMEFNTPKLAGVRHCLEGGPYAVSLAIWIYFGLRAVFQLFHGISSMMIDNGLSNFFRGPSGNRGQYIIWSYISSGILTPLAGFSVDFRSDNGNVDSSSYTWLFLAFGGFVIIVISLIGAIEFESLVLPPIKDSSRLILKMLRDTKIVILLCLVLIIGAVNGFFETFLFWHLENLSTPYWVMGLTTSSGIIIGGPLLAKRASSALGNLGKNNLMLLCVTFQFLRCLGYYFANNFWWSILFEFFGVVVFHLLWKIVSLGRKAFIPYEGACAFQAFAGVLYYSIGKCCGSLVGGAISNAYNFKFAFLSFGSLCGISIIVFTLLNQTFNKKLARNRSARRSTAAELEGSNSTDLVKSSSALLLQCSVKEADGTSTEKDTETSKLNNIETSFEQFNTR